VDLDPLPLATALGLLVALFGMWRSERALARSKRNELYLLRQTVRLKAEAVRTEWYKLDRENDSLIHRLALKKDLPTELQTMMYDFLQGGKENLNICIADACAVAEDAHRNSENYSEKKCRALLSTIEVSIEKLRRNQGESERRFDQLMERAAAQRA